MTKEKTSEIKPTLDWTLPPLERRIKFELARRGWTELELRQRIEEVTGKRCSSSRMSYLIKAKNPRTTTLTTLAEALGIPVKRFFEEEL